MVTLVEEGSNVAFSDSDSMSSVIEGLTKCVLTRHIDLLLLVLTKELHSEMKRALDVVNRISSQRLETRILLSAFDKAAVDECNRQMVLACGIFGVRKPDNLPSIRSSRFLLIKLDTNCIYLTTSHRSD